MNENKVTEVFTDQCEDFEIFNVANQPESLEINSPKNFARNDFQPPNLNFPNMHRSFLERPDEKSVCLNERPKSKSFDINCKVGNYFGKKNFIGEITKTPKNNVLEINDIDKIEKKEPIFLGKLFLVKKFIKKLRESTSFRTAKWLNSFHYELINDWVSFPPQHANQDNICLLRFYKDLKRHQHIYSCLNVMKQMISWALFKNGKLRTLTLSPTANFRLFWDLLMILVTIYNFVMIPLKVAFEKETFFLNTNFLSELSLYIFLVDILINLSTAYYSKGELIFSRKLIFLNYTMKGLIFFDLLSVFVLILTDSFQMQLSALFFLFRLRNLSKTVSRFEEFLFSDETTNNMIGFIRLIFIIFLFSHWCACYYLLLGKSELPYGWTVIYNVSTSNMMTQYVSALYFIVVVMNTVGFGDMVANTLTERGFVIGFIMIASIVFAYTINQIGTILYNINRNERELKRTMNLINGYMKAKNINFHLKVKIRNYLEYLWHTEKNQNSNETSDVINKLSKNLKDELLLNANGVVLKDVPMLTNNFSEESLRKVVYELKEINLTPGEIIYHQNDTTNLNCYIIRDGEIGLFLETNRTNIEKPSFLKIYQKGGYFGEFSFFSGFNRQTSAKSLSFSSLFVINQESFLRILKEVPEDYEKYCSIKHQINFSNNYSELHRKCFSCEIPNHTELNCPKLHLILSKELVLKKYNFSLPQKRTQFLHNPKKIRFNSLKNYSYIQKKAFLFVKYFDKNEACDNENENEESLADLESEESDKGTPLLRDQRNFKEKKEDSLINKKRESCSTPNNSNKRDSIPTQITSIKGDDYVTVEIASKNERLLSDPSKKNEEKNIKSILIPSLNSDDHINNKKEERMRSDHQLQMTSGGGWSTVMKEEEKKLVFDVVKSYAVYFPNDNIEEFIEKIHQYFHLKKSRKKSYHALKLHAESTSNVVSPILSIRKTPKKELPIFFPKASVFRNKSIEENMIIKNKNLKKNFDFSKGMQKMVLSLKTTARKVLTKLKF